MPVHDDKSTQHRRGAKCWDDVIVENAGKSLWNELNVFALHESQQQQQQQQQQFAVPYMRAAVAVPYMRQWAYMRAAVAFIYLFIYIRRSNEWKRLYFIEVAPASLSNKKRNNIRRKQNRATHTAQDLPRPFYCVHCGSAPT